METIQISTVIALTMATFTLIIIITDFVRDIKKTTRKGRVWRTRTY